MGQSKKQLSLLPESGIFIWKSHDLALPKRFVDELKRSDVIVLSRKWLQHPNALKSFMTSFVQLDHQLLDGGVYKLDAIERFAYSAIVRFGNMRFCQNNPCPQF